MQRREFIKRSTLAAIAASSLGSLTSTFSNSILADNNYDLVAVKGGEPDAMFDRAITAMGGIRKFVKKGQTVVVKPNIGWDVVPEKAACTNPKLVSRIIKHCFEAGAKDVYVFDHTCDNWTRCYSSSGIEKAARDAGAKVVSGSSESYYQDVKIKSGKNLKEAKVHELILNSNVFINVPILKEHGSSRITIGMKNLMGVVWDRGYWHSNDLNQCIADFATYRRPDLTIVDAYNVMLKNGPRGRSKDDLVLMKSLIVSTDIVAADAASAKIFGINPDTISYINYADELNAGTKDLTKLKINRIIM